MKNDEKIDPAIYEPFGATQTLVKPVPFVLP